MITNSSQKNNLYQFIMGILSPFKKYIFIHIFSLAAFMFVITWLPVLVSRLATDLYMIPTLLVIITIANLFISVMIRIYHYIVWVKFVPSLQQYISTTVLDNLLQKKYGFYAKNFSGDVSKKRTDLVQELSNVYDTVVEGLFFSFITLIGVFIALTPLPFKYNFMIMIWFLSFTIFSLYFAPKLSRLSNESAAFDAKMNGLSTDIMNNILSVKLFNLEKYESEKFEQSNEKNRLLKVKLELIYYGVYTFYSLTFVLMVAYASWHLWTDYKMDVISISDMILFLQLVLALVGRLWSLTEKMQKLITGKGKLQVAFNTLMQDEQTQVVEKATMKIANPEIVFDNVGFAHEGKQQLFKNLSFRIPAGQKVGLVGYSGAGKTTIISLLLKLFEVQEGSVKISGVDIKNISEEDLYESISVITQDSVLFHRSVYENIACGRLDATKEEVMDAAKKAQAHEFIMELEDGYDTNVGEKGSRLSGGQRQRIMIARAILKNAQIMIMDEVTSQLDSENESIIQQNLVKIMQGKTTIVIAHRLSTLQVMDRLLVFDKGRLLEDGVHSLLLQKPGGLYAQLWNKQIGAAK